MGGLVCPSNCRTDNLMISSYRVLAFVGVVRILLLYATVSGVKAGPSASFYVPRQFLGSTVSQFGGAWVLYFGHHISPNMTSFDYNGTAQ